MKGEYLEAGENDDHHDTVLPRGGMSQRQDLLDSEISEIDPAEQMRPRIHRFVGPPKHTATN